jgi:hypothetical protein
MSNPLHEQTKKRRPAATKSPADLSGVDRIFRDAVSGAGLSSATSFRIDAMKFNDRRRGRLRFEGHPDASGEEG